MENETKSTNNHETNGDVILRALTDEQIYLAERRKEMEAVSDKEITKRIFHIAWPATVEALLQSTIRIVTSALLGHMPGAALAISASGLADRLIRLSWGLFAAVGTGSTVMIARSIGAGNQENANSFAAQALTLGAIFMLAITSVLLIFPSQLMNLLFNRGGAMDPELMTTAIAFMRITAWSVPLMGINQILGAIMRGAGNTRVTLYTNTIANLVNAALGYILIFGNFGAPTMGITGAALATVISQGVGAIIAIVIFFFIQKDLKIQFAKLRLKLESVKQVFSIGVPHASEMLLMQFGQIALAGLVGSMGVVALAAHTQGIVAESISFLPAMGFGIAATTLVGMSVGVGSVTLVKRYVKVLAKCNIALTAFTASILIFAPRQIFGVLTNDPDVIALGAIYLMIMGFCQFPQQLTGVFAGTLRGSGDAKATLFNSLIGLWVVRIPLSFLFANFFGWGIIGVWSAMAIDLVVRFILTIIRYLRGKWQRTALQIAGEEG